MNLSDPMHSALYATWALLVVVSVVASIVSASSSPRPRATILSLVGIVPLVAAILVKALGGSLVSGVVGVDVLTVTLLVLLGVLGGSPLTAVVFEFAAREERKRAQASAVASRTVLVEAPKRTWFGRKQEPTREWKSVTPTVADVDLLRGGMTIGYLERVATIGCIVTGHVEGLAVIVAIKALGRFSDLTNAAARERFIIGTLVSLIWAATCAAVIVLASA